jgi:hypothetical protein
MTRKKNSFIKFDHRRLVCQCRDGYEGSKCETRVATDPQPEAPIIVTITEPKIQIAQVPIIENIFSSTL